MLNRGHHSTGCHPSLSSFGFSLALVSCCKWAEWICWKQNRSVNLPHTFKYASVIVLGYSRYRKSLVRIKLYCSAICCFSPAEQCIIYIIKSRWRKPDFGPCPNNKKHMLFSFVNIFAITQEKRNISHIVSYSISHIAFPQKWHYFFFLWCFSVLLL